MEKWRKLHFSVWKSSQVMKLPLQARVLYFYLITSGDDHGRLKVDGPLLREAFPYDDFNGDQVAAWRDIIERAGLIRIYEKDGELYAYHINWKKYQGGRGTNVRPDRKESDLPNPDQPSANILPTKCQRPANALPTKSQPIADTEERRGDKKRRDNNAPPEGDIVKNLLEETTKGGIRHDYQYFGLDLYEKTQAPKNKKGECIRIARDYPKENVLTALSFCLDYPKPELKWKMFLWKLNQKNDNTNAKKPDGQSA